MAEHPLPWRWVEDEGFWYLQDSEGHNLIAFEHDPFYGVAMTPYVRAVTERAGTMEALLRKFVRLNLAADDFGIHSADSLQGEAEALLAEIDAAKGLRDG